MADSELKYCPRCAGPLEWRSIEYPDVNHPACKSCGFVLWQNRKLSVEALIVRGDGAATEILLGRMAEGAAKGRWDIPGGFINASDRLHDALVRECRREMGIDVKVGELLGLWEEDSFYGIPLVTAIYICMIASGEPRPADLIDDVRWFPLSEPPELAWPAVERAVAQLGRRAGRL